MYYVKFLKYFNYYLKYSKQNLKKLFYVKSSLNIYSKLENYFQTLIYQANFKITFDFLFLKLENKFYLNNQLLINKIIYFQLLFVLKK